MKVLYSRCEGLDVHAGSVTARTRCTPRNVPDRKGDMNDATRIVDLLAHWLIRSSFVSPAPVQIDSSANRMSAASSSREPIMAPKQG
jgi:hypothetical protein